MLNKRVRRVPSDIVGISTNAITFEACIQSATQETNSRVRQEYKYIPVGWISSHFLRLWGHVRQPVFERGKLRRTRGLKTAERDVEGGTCAWAVWGVECFVGGLGMVERAVEY